LFARDRLLGTLVILVAGAICVRLGVWQLDRLAQRRDFNHHVLAAQEMAPLDLPSSEDLSMQEYRTVRAEGTYDFEHQFAIRNQFYNGENGFDLITPLLFGTQASDGQAGAEAVLVDRGWIPAATNGSASDWRKYDEPSRAGVAGLLRLAVAAPSLAGLAEPTPVARNGRIDFWIFMDIDGIQKQLPYSLMAVYIQKSPEPDSVSPPIAVTPTLDLSEGPHLGYAMQWFGFAALFVVGYPLYLRKQEGRST
jgi:surfeit locus 1 family protein